MQKYLIMLFLIVVAFTGLGCSDAADTPRPKAEGEGGCKSQFYALADNAVVELKGSGELDVVVVTDPLCWHCRLGHKLLSEYPEKFRSLKMIFFPRKSFIGSDMAAWILEDMAETDKLKALVDFAYKDLKQPKIGDLTEARMTVLAQFVAAFPYLMDGTTMPELFVRLQKECSAHVLKTAELSRAAKLPGTPILVAGRVIVIGYGPDTWIEALDKNQVCP